MQTVRNPCRQARRSDRPAPFQIADPACPSRIVASPRHTSFAAIGRQINVDQLENMPEHSLDLAIRHFLIGKRHLHIELRKFRLAVGPEVFVAKTSGDLVILVKAGDHRQLFEYLRRLRQSKEFTGMYSRRHDKIAGTLGRRFEQYRRLDLDKTAVRQNTRGSPRRPSHAYEYCAAIADGAGRDSGI